MDLSKSLDFQISEYLSILPLERNYLRASWHDYFCYLKILI